MVFDSPRVSQTRRTGLPTPRDPRVSQTAPRVTDHPSGGFYSSPWCSSSTSVAWRFPNQGDLAKHPQRGSVANRINPLTPSVEKLIPWRFLIRPRVLQTGSQGPGPQTRDGGSTGSHRALLQSGVQTPAPAGGPHRPPRVTDHPSPTDWVSGTGWCSSRHHGPSRQGGAQAGQGSIDVATLPLNLALPLPLKALFLCVFVSSWFVSHRDGSAEGLPPSVHVARLPGRASPTGAPMVQAQRVTSPATSSP
jgi:hypothetical protein